MSCFSTYSYNIWVGKIIFYFNFMHNFKCTFLFSALDNISLGGWLGKLNQDLKMFFFLFIDFSNCNCNLYSQRQQQKDAFDLRKQRVLKCDGRRYNSNLLWTNYSEETESDPDRPIRALRKVSIYALVTYLNLQMLQNTVCLP